MRKFKLRKNQYIVYYKEDYYVVNKFTADFIDKLSDSKNLDELANKMKVSLKKVTKLAKKFLIKEKKSQEYRPNFDLPGPIKVQWKTTQVCNLKCKHCYLGKLNQTCLSENQMQEIVTKLINSPINEITLTGGEVLTVKNIFSYIKQFIDNEIYVTIFTNGTLLKQFLENNDITNFQKYINICVSIDGTQEYHDEIRGKGNYEKSIEGIKKALSLGIKTTINTVLNTINISSIKDMVVELNEMGIKYIQLSNLLVMGSADLKLKPSFSQEEKLKKEISGLVNSAILKNLHIWVSDKSGEDEVANNYNYIDENGKKSIGKENWICTAGMTRMTIDFQGDVYCCPFCKEFRIGNILLNNIDEIWNNPVRFQFLSYLAKFNKGSRMCIFSKNMDMVI